MFRLGQGSKRGPGCCCNLFYDDFENNDIGIPGSCYTSTIGHWTVSGGILSTIENSTIITPIILTQESSNETIFSYEIRVKFTDKAVFQIGIFSFDFTNNNIKIVNDNYPYLASILRQCDYTFSTNTWYKIKILSKHGFTLYIDDTFITNYHDSINDNLLTLPVLSTIKIDDNTDRIDIDYILIEASDESLVFDYASSNILAEEWQKEREPSFNSPEILYCGEPPFRNRCWPIGEEILDQVQVDISGVFSFSTGCVSGINCDDINGTWILDLKYEQGNPLYNSIDDKIIFTNITLYESDRIQAVYRLTLPTPITIGVGCITPQPLDGTDIYLGISNPGDEEFCTIDMFLTNPVNSGIFSTTTGAGAGQTIEGFDRLLNPSGNYFCNNTEELYSIEPTSRFFGCQGGGGEISISAI